MDERRSGMTPLAMITPPYEMKRLLEPMLTTAEGAALLGISEATLRKWIRDGRVPCIRLGRTVRLRVADVKALQNG
jgi:excisionase family DNA binding protein